MPRALWLYHFLTLTSPSTFSLEMIFFYFFFYSPHGSGCSAFMALHSSSIGATVWPRGGLRPGPHGLGVALHWGNTGERPRTGVGEGGNPPCRPCTPFVPGNLSPPPLWGWRLGPEGQDAILLEGFPRRRAGPRLYGAALPSGGKAPQEDGVLALMASASLPEGESVAPWRAAPWPSWPRRSPPRGTWLAWRRVGVWRFSYYLFLIYFLIIFSLHFI